MGFSARLTSDKGSTVYGVNAPGNGKFLRAFDVSDPKAVLSKIHPPGTMGNLIQRNGFVGRQITMCVRYVAVSIEKLEYEIRKDIDRYAQEAQLIEHNVQEYNGCNLDVGSVRRGSAILPTGRLEDQVFVDIVMTFSEDLPTINELGA